MASSKSGCAYQGWGLGFGVTTVVYWGYIGIMENSTETTILLGLYLASKVYQRPYHLDPKSKPYRPNPKPYNLRVILGLYWGYTWAILE